MVSRKLEGGGSLAPPAVSHTYSNTCLDTYIQVSVVRDWVGFMGWVLLEIRVVGCRVGYGVGFGSGFRDWC